ncbi:MAG: cellulase family glycosylhydrolase [Caldilineaceae bacterium]|nr:cellulase family glycosylhydrolase [Caldilineaceae bacterium]
MPSPIHIHPENPKLFEFRGKPLVLVTATEHYGAVMNRPFNFEKYLADAAEKGITLTRLFMLFRELQTPINPYSTCKPETPDYIAPFARTGPGRALDHELKFDLDRPNPEFYARLHRFLTLASEYGIIVEVVLFSNSYSPEVWSLNPLNTKNNVNDVEEIEWPDYLSQRHAKLFAHQLAHLTKIVTETNRYDNVIYEICNEPGGNAPGDNRPSCDEVNKWLTTMISTIHQIETDLPNQHLIAGQEAFSYVPWEQSSDHSFQTLGYDIVNMHPLPETTYNGRSYNLGQFMSKQLALRALQEYCLATYDEPKPLNQDEDNIASQYKDVEAWTIHRKRAWVTLLSGAHYDYIDFSITIYSETGTAQSQQAIRGWMKHLSTFIHSFDLERARPLTAVIEQTPPFVLGAAFGVPNEDFCVYLADERELPAARDLPDGQEGNPEAGFPITGTVVLNLPETTYQASCFDPKSGLYSPATTIHGGQRTRVTLPSFVHDIAIRFRRALA